jgi:CRP-like cAMP-binding protein
MSSALGKRYADGAYIVRQGDQGSCMYVIQSGEVEIIRHEQSQEILLATRSSGEFVGEMALFEKETRMADVRAKGEAVVLTIDKKNLLSRIQADPSVAFRLIETLSGRVRELSTQIAGMKSKG